jgi:UDP:flavonoid glycosyltransferase YjiC (YdhE family)
MRPVLTNAGSTGDIKPLVALARELKRRGHEPVLALSPCLSHWSERYGLDFHATGPDLIEAIRTINLAFVSKTKRGVGSFEDIEALFAPINRALPQIVRDLLDACRGADVLIGGTGQLTSKLIHEITGVPFVSVQFEHANWVHPPDQPGSIGERWRRMAARQFGRLLAELDLEGIEPPEGFDPRSSQLVLFAMSPRVCARPDNWPEHYRMVGFFFMEDEKDETERELAEFLSDGEPPVVFSFGSMVHEDAQVVAEIVLEAVRLSGYRGVIQRGWSGLPGKSVREQIYSAEYVSHSWLFPRAACVVHHGGAGTLATALWAGVPSVIVPHAFDQPFWAENAYALGYTVPPILFSDLTAERLAVAIAMTLADPRFRSKAERLSEHVRSERGAEKAARLIEEVAGQ